MVGDSREFLIYSGSFDGRAYEVFVIVAMGVNTFQFMLPGNYIKLEVVDYCINTGTFGSPKKLLYDEFTNYRNPEYSKYFPSSPLPQVQHDKVNRNKEIFELEQQFNKPVDPNLENKG